MTDIILEISAAFLAGIILLVLIYHMSIQKAHSHNGSKLILYGFGLLFFGMLIDITDNYPELNYLIVIGNTEVQAFLEKVLGTFFGLLLLVIGFYRWLQHLRKTTISRDSLIEEIAIRKKVETELESNRAQFAGILEIAKDAIISINEEQHIIIFNKGAEATFGYTEEYALGKSIDLFLPNQICKAHHQHIKNFSESDVDTRQMGKRKEMFGLHKNGSKFPVEATISKLLINGDKILTVILRNVSVHKNIEKQLKDHALLLEQAVDQKSSEMQALTERLVRQEKLATAGKISSNIAHELRNPLGSIQQSIFYLRRLLAKGADKKFFDKVGNSLQLIDSELNNANTVITNLLDATRAKSLSQSLVDLEKLTHDAVTNNSFISMLDIKFHLEPNPFLIIVDPDQFRQIIVNLLTNAQQNGGNDVQVTIHGRFLLDINRVLIQIEDNGPGIMEEDIDKVFEPLFTTREMGNGLGLSICKQLIENHNGTISISNQKKQGTMVEIQLPKDQPT